MKILRVGDPHITVSNVIDGQRLITFILKIAKEREIDAIEFLGDLFHTHAVKRLEVEYFWRISFQKIKTLLNIPVIVLVGNHDMPGSKEKEQQMNALDVFNGINNVVVVNRPAILNGIAYIPYMSDKEAFINEAKALHKEGALELLVAHQTFTGATYDNGFYAEDGIDPALVPQTNIISGHIHTSQEVGKCFYPGTSKWDSVTDANKEKGIWIYDHNKDGSVKNKELIPTKGVVTSINKYIVEEGEFLPEIISSDMYRNYIELKGKTPWIAKMKKKYKGLAKIKATPTDRRVASEDNKSTTIYDHLEKKFIPIDGVSKVDIKKYLKENTIL